MKVESYFGTKYWFDNNLGIVYPLDPILEKKVSTNPDNRIACIDNQNDDAFDAQFMKKIEKIKRSIIRIQQKELTPNEIKRQILQDGLLQITMSITEACNLACRYCYYSDIYTYSRKPSTKKMDFQTAKKALDYYASLIKEGERFNPLRTPTIGFYGGEPLLNFDLIKKCVSYFEKTYPEMDTGFTITTNGTLLDEKKSDYLMEHNFSIAISIDGPENEHNRNRIYPDGSGTFSDIIKNIKTIMDAGYKKCHSLCVFDWKSDLFALQDFFSRDDIPPLALASMPNIYDGCLYYERFTQEDRVKYRESEAEAFKWYIEHVRETGYKGSFFDNIFGLHASKTLFSVPSLINYQTYLIPYTGSCLPGRKIYVDVGGKYHICERVNHTFPIGDIENGLDFNRIANLVYDYGTHLDQCPICQVQKLCGLCYCAFGIEGKFRFSSEICKDPLKNQRIALSWAFTLGEIDPMLPGSISENYYSWLAEISPTMGD